MDRRRKQIYLEREQEEELSELALAAGRSESAIIREALGEYLAKAREKAGATDNPLARLLEIKAESTATDGSEHHDRDLYGAPTQAGPGAPPGLGSRRDSQQASYTTRKSKVGAD